MDHLNLSFRLPSSANGSAPGPSFWDLPFKLLPAQVARLTAHSLRLNTLVGEVRRPGNGYQGCTISCSLDDIQGIHSGVIDQEAVDYLIWNLGREHIRGSQSPRHNRIIKIEYLSRVANAAWYLECNPSSLCQLWDRLERPWQEFVVEHDRDEFCWRRQRPSVSTGKACHYANTAYILQKDDVFAQAIQFVVWDSLQNRIATSVEDEDLRNIAAVRERYLRRVFNHLLTEITLLQSSKRTWEIAAEIRKRIEESDLLGIRLLSNEGPEAVINALDHAWGQGEEILAQFSVYGFIHQVDVVLLNGTSAYCPPRVSAPSFSPKEVGRVNWLGLFRLSSRDQYTETVEKLLSRISTQIQLDQHTFTECLIRKRDDKLEEWISKLRQSPSLPPTQANGSNGLNGHAT
ncbi:hypothetical protein N656DRAFT_101710 [Canariomyces notabilis]|uniref:Uncharacterized protein n=1 Tax=Canariomyces notabilis TaxID=2074819 RepID=A0AAN6YS73_9PEZI|nr:hypothetical protein N656DRAFT_101710 [Canariomyces arenarius]